MKRKAPSSYSSAMKTLKDDTHRRHRFLVLRRGYASPRSPRLSHRVKSQGTQTHHRHPQKVRNPNPNPNRPTPSLLALLGDAGEWEGGVEIDCSKGGCCMLIPKTAEKMTTDGALSDSEVVIELANYLLLSVYCCLRMIS
ncbi:hypothetical protein MtrunA17_Chr1g0155711 [Medicago truncatula]|uniref:Uncharacterized protein n=1 Tax=Medicago truncatula TaxID=3880 RepID=A0A072VF12_MEDTR|nr:hypothetical protein MTR_1g023125 [Medicago truncatula]RHN77523.1 hypothetical protein MtrunA17_Chr1g0155711 [Medicago truncatula]